MYNWWINKFLIKSAACPSYIVWKVKYSLHSYVQPTMQKYKLRNIQKSTSVTKAKKTHDFPLCHHILPPNWHCSPSAKMNGTQTSTSMWNPLYVQRYAKRGWSNVEGKKIKPEVLAIIELPLSEGISQFQWVTRKLHSVATSFRKSLPNQYCPIIVLETQGWFIGWWYLMGHTYSGGLFYEPC